MGITTDPMSNIVKSDGCWKWKGGHTESGYAVMYYRKAVKQYRLKRVHRVVYEIFNGEIPKGMMIRHICDNPSCVNPEHLLVGSHQDNMQDMKDRNRRAVGDKLPQTKLTPKEVSTIRRLHKEGQTMEYGWNELRPYSIAGLSRKYGVTTAAISNIVNNKVWKHLTER